MKLLSIVVPAYNEEAYLGRLLDTIIGIDTRPLGFEKEILVVNDGSKDRTEEIARGFAGQGAQLLVRCAALNRMTQLGRPDSYRA